MSKKAFFTFVSILFTINVLAQCPTASFDLLNQAQVNSFPTDYPGCSVIADGIDIKIMGNDITDLTPLIQINGTSGVLEIRDCPLLTSLNGLQNITYIGNDALDGFILRDLPLLNSLSYLSSLDSVTGEFTIRTCASLTNLNGLQGLTKANGSLIIRDNASLSSLSGLDNLTYIGETLELVENIQLSDVSALSNVNTIVGGLEGGVFIEANDILASLNGLGNANTIITGNLDLLLNGDLSLCSVPSICNYLNNPPVGAVITINGNLTGCNTQLEIESGCSNLSIAEEFQNKITVYPNPFSDYFKVESLVEDVTYQLTDISGKVVSEGVLKSNESIYLSYLTKGIYFLKINSVSQLKESQFQKVIKN